jgi:hypothetical protein
MVRPTGLEPAHLSAYAPQTYVSTNSTTAAPTEFVREVGRKLQRKPSLVNGQGICGIDFSRVLPGSRPVPRSR